MPYKKRINSSQLKIVQTNEKNQNRCKNVKECAYDAYYTDRKNVWVHTKCKQLWICQATIACFSCSFRNISWLTMPELAWIGGSNEFQLFSSTAISPFGDLNLSGRLWLIYWELLILMQNFEFRDGCIEKQSFLFTPTSQ